MPSVRGFESGTAERSQAAYDLESVRLSWPTGGGLANTSSAVASIAPRRASNSPVASKPRVHQGCTPFVTSVSSTAHIVSSSGGPEAARNARSPSGRENRPMRLCLPTRSQSADPAPVSTETERGKDHFLQASERPCACLGTLSAPPPPLLTLISNRVPPRILTESPWIPRPTRYESSRVSISTTNGLNQSIMASVSLPGQIQRTSSVLPPPSSINRTYVRSSCPFPSSPRLRHL